MIPYGRQEITQTDIDAVVRVLRSDFLTQGPAVQRFENAVAARVGAKYAVAVNSGTSALHIACMALGLQPGDSLWTVPNTFVASANCGRYCGANVDFVDIDPQTWNLSVAALAEKLAQAEHVGRLPKVVVPVHFGGQPTEQEAIWKLAQKYGFKVLEDASHSVGAARSGEPVGSCRWSHVTVFSFHPVKIVTSGEGGMALTNDRRVAETLSMLRSHGITRDPSRLRLGAQLLQEASAGGSRHPAWYYEQQMLGFNYRITDIHAALGLSQLDRLSDYVERRNALANRYRDALRNLPLRLPFVHPENHSAFHLYVVRVKSAALSGTHRQVFDKLRRQGIGANLHYFPVHLQPYYRELGFSPGQYPEAEAHGSEAITLPLYPGLSDQMQEMVISSLRRALEA
jgi:UDP-4-amino-4,6-dideoxy-N-acetyl-beta-L-altrosamine transaminase